MILAADVAYEQSHCALANVILAFPLRRPQLTLPTPVAATPADASRQPAAPAQFVDVPTLWVCTAAFNSLCQRMKRLRACAPPTRAGAQVGPPSRSTLWSELRSCLLAVVPRLCRLAT